MIRRDFLKRSAAAVAAPLIVPAHALGRGAVPPGEKIVLGGIGLGPRGAYDLKWILQEEDVRFVAVCDVQRKRAEAALRDRPRWQRDV